MYKIAVVTDMDFAGSGYFYLMTPLLSHLAGMECEIKVAGLSYTGLEHTFPFSVIPCKDLQDSASVVSNLAHLWQPDIIIVGMDIPIQIHLASIFQPLQKPYVAITPLENGPLTMSWAAGMFNMSHIFFISELGKQEAMKSGLQRVDHLRIGVDPESWKPALPEEKAKIRSGLGIAEDEFVIITVADNQERKNLSAAMEVVSNLKKDGNKVRYILVTREQNQFGWKLRDLAVRLDINQETSIYERGIPRQNLWGLYAASDLYLCTSKAEGLGMPILDAMAAKIPIVATDTGALHELLQDGRGFLIPSKFTFIDVWGNSWRDMIHTEVASHAILSYMANPDIGEPDGMVDKAYQYVKSRTWDVPAKQVYDVISRLVVK